MNSQQVFTSSLLETNRLIARQQTHHLTQLKRVCEPWCASY
jgi:hypothetical protein